jgi:hypothetical protein
MAGGYSNFEIVSYFDIRISDLSPAIGRANLQI